MDVRDANVRPAVNAYRQSLLRSDPLPAPCPLIDCPDGFGNGGIFGGSYLDPTP
jgi:hypothetical protein